MTYYDVWKRLEPVYGAGEAKALARFVLEARFGLSMTDICCGATERMDDERQAELETIVRRLEDSEPVQYLLGTACFCERDFRVEPGILIPRPETEELCNWITDSHGHADNGLSVLDVGTGSGCIAVTLALGMPKASVAAWDISPVAVRVARDNATRLGAEISIVIQNALNPPETGKWDIIVSNPPYIYNRDRKEMERNVLEHEPHTALFVPDDNPLLFYDAISRYAMRTLRPGGMVYFEINPLCAEAMARMLAENGFCDVECRKDMFGKERMMRARKE